MALVEEPVTRLPQKTGRVLVYELTSRNARSRDWRGLACFIGFTSRHIQLIEENQKPEKAWLVFEAWDRTGKSSIRLLIIALKQLGYQSSLDILMDSEELRDVNFAGIFAEVEQLKAMGGDEMVKTKLFPRFEEAGIILYPGMFSEERGLVKVKPCSIPHSQSPQPASKLQQCSPPPADGECVGELVHQLQQNSISEPQRDRRDSPIQLSPIKPNTVFISYYPESAEHTHHVASLAQQLKAQGYFVSFDEFCKTEISKSGGLTRWKESCIQVAENIVVVCSPNYYREDLELSDYNRMCRVSELHVAVDTHLLRPLAYTRSGERLIPVVMGEDDPEVCTPIWLWSHLIHRWPIDKRDLLRFIAGIPKFKLPPIVERITLRPTIIDFPEAYDWDVYDEEPPE